jgi:undecaprenyl-diphosphatase
LSRLWPRGSIFETPLFRGKSFQYRPAREPTPRQIQLRALGIQRNTVTFAPRPIIMLHSLLLGFVEGLTEFLPVSSTGHLLLVESWLGIHRSDAFNVLIQVGPILAVALVFYRTLFEFIVGLKDPKVRDELVKLIVCVGIIGAGGLLMKRLGLSLPETPTPVAIALLVGGIAIFIVEGYARRRTLSDNMSWAAVIAVAVGQLLAAAFPGTSRSGAAILAALLFSTARPRATRFAFLSGIPIMLAAGALELKEAQRSGELNSLLTLDTLAAFGVATVVAFLSVVWLMRWIQTRDFRAFGYYRIAIGALLLAPVMF